MNFDYLSEFIELAHCLNFTEAAQHLHITQSTLSKHISSLEKELGVQLFVRHHDGARLTEEGFAFFGSATNIIDIYTATREKLQEMRASTALRIDGQLQNPNVSALISTAIARYRTLHNGSVKFNRNQTKSAIDLLADGALDLVIQGESAKRLSERGLAFTRICALPFVAILDTDHPLAQKESLSLNDLRDEVFLQFLDEYSASGWRSIEEACKNHGFNPKRRPVLTQSVTEQLAMPLLGGILLFPRTTKELRYLTVSSQRACIPIVDDDGIFPIYAIYRPEPSSQVVQFVECLKQAEDYFQS